MFLISYLFGDACRYCNVLGIGAILALAYFFSVNRKKINSRLVASALGLQFLFGILMLKTWTGQFVVGKIAAGVRSLYFFSEAGIKFIFGNLAVGQGYPWGVVFGFQILPMIIFFGALMALLFYFGIIQVIVSAIGKVLRPLLGTSGAETLCAISNSFL